MTPQNYNKTIINLNKKLQGVRNANTLLIEKCKKLNEQARKDHDRKMFLKKELLKLNPEYELDNSEKFHKKLKIRKRDKFLCCFCKRNIFEISTDKTLHHKIPKRYGGKDTQKNQITICEDCHTLLEELIKYVEDKAIEFAIQNENK